MSNLAERSKVNLDLGNLFIAIVSLGLTYQVGMMTKASTVVKEINFSKKTYKCLSLCRLLWQNNCLPHHNR